MSSWFVLEQELVKYFTRMLPFYHCICQEFSSILQAWFSDTLTLCFVVYLDLYMVILIYNGVGFRVIVMFKLDNGFSLLICGNAGYLD